MQNQNLLEDNLTREELQALRNKRAGMFIFQVSWIMAFLCLVMVNWQLSYSADWLPEGAERASLLPATFATGALLLSCFLARRALSAIQDDDRPRFLIEWLGTVGLGGLFIGVMVFEFFSIAPGSQYAQVFRLMTGFHMVHAFVIGAYLLGVYFQARDGHYGSLDSWAIEAGVKLWYFVFIAWAIFYVTIYWIAW